MRGAPGRDMSSEHLGQRIRAVRLARKYTLADVARLTGMSRSFLSMLENGKTNISAARLQRLASVFDLSISDLLPDERSRGLIQIVRQGQGPRLQGFAEGISANLLIRDMQRRIQPVLLVLQPGRSHRNTHGHAGEEFIYVLDGELEVSIDDGEFEMLAAGDAAFYPSALSHEFRNPGPEACRLLTISTPNTWFHS